MYRPYGYAAVCLLAWVCSFYHTVGSARVQRYTSAATIQHWWSCLLLSLQCRRCTAVLLLCRSIEFTAGLLQCKLRQVGSECTTVEPRILCFFREGSVGASLASQDLPLGHRLLPLLVERSSFPLISSSTLFFSCRKYHHRNLLPIFIFFREGSVGASLASQDLPFGHRLLLLLAARSSFSAISSFTFILVARRIIITGRAELSLAHQLSSAQQRRSVRCGAQPCRAVLCRAE